MPQRICIYTSDVMALTGRGEDYARRLLREIRQHYGKPPRSVVTVQEFAEYMSVRVEEVQEQIR